MDSAGMRGREDGGGHGIVSTAASAVDQYARERHAYIYAHFVGNPEGRGLENGWEGPGVGGDGAALLMNET